MVTEATSLPESRFASWCCEVKGRPPPMPTILLHALTWAALHLSLAWVGRACWWTGAAFALTLVQVQYVMHDVFHHQWRLETKGWAYYALARFVTPALCGYGETYWVFHEHGPHHSFTATSKDPDEDYEERLWLGGAQGWWSLCPSWDIWAQSWRHAARRRRYDVLFWLCLHASLSYRNGWRWELLKTLAYHGTMAITQLFHHRFREETVVKEGEPQWRHTIRNTLNTGPHGWWLRLWMGGHNYQIEHHVFPSVSRFLLGSVAHEMRDWCSVLGLPYTTLTVPEQLARVWLVRSARFGGRS